MQTLCPVIFHPDGTPLRHLLAHDSKKGARLLTCAIKPGMDPTESVIDMLSKEAGLTTTSVLPMGQLDTVVQNENWMFLLCRLQTPVRETWKHAPEGGSALKFTWLDVHETPPGLHRKYVRALNWIRQRTS